MINSLTELDEAIKKGQQFERKSPMRKGWVVVNEILNYPIGDAIKIIGEGRLRVRQVKGQ